MVIQRRQAGARAAPAHEVRLIGGRWKRSKLPVLDRPGLRPTPDRVRETLFNWLGQDLGGLQVLDAFAGTGALGFEAASRGACPVVLLERDPVLTRHLLDTAARLGAADEVEVVTTDALAWLRGAASGPRRFDVVFLDPPFSASLFEPALRAAATVLSDDGWLYLEADREFAEPHLPEGLVRWRHAKAGMVHYHLLRRAPAADFSPRPPTDRSSP